MKYRVFNAIACATTVASMVMLFSASTASALPANESITTYYSDASETTIVGTHYLVCDGNHKQMGVVTQYAETETASCDFVSGEEAPGMECLIEPYNFPDGTPAEVCGFAD